MGERDKTGQMEIARAYVGAFIVGGLAAAVAAGALMIALAPADRSLVLKVALAAGAVGGLTAAWLPILREWIFRVINFIKGW
jgi:hypothetical protein